MFKRFLNISDKNELVEGGSDSFDRQETQGFLCPMCMLKLDTAASLQHHFETAHPANDTSDESNKDELEMFKMQLRASEDSRTLLSSEVILMRKQNETLTITINELNHEKSTSVKNTSVLNDELIDELAKTREAQVQLKGLKDHMTTLKKQLNEKDDLIDSLKRSDNSEKLVNDVHLSNKTQLQQNYDCLQKKYDAFVETQNSKTQILNNELLKNEKVHSKLIANTKDHEELINNLKIKLEKSEKSNQESMSNYDDKVKEFEKERSSLDKHLQDFKNITEKLNLVEKDLNEERTKSEKLNQEISQKLKENCAMKSDYDILEQQYTELKNLKNETSEKDCEMIKKYECELDLMDKSSAVYAEKIDKLEREIKCCQDNENNKTENYDLKIKMMNSERDQVDGKVIELTEEIQRLKDEKNDSLQKVDNLNVDLESMLSSLDVNEKGIEDLKRNLREKEQSLVECTRDLNDCRASLADLTETNNKNSEQILDLGDAIYDLEKSKKESTEKLVNELKEKDQEKENIQIKHCDEIKQLELNNSKVTQDFTDLQLKITDSENNLSNIQKLIESEACEKKNSVTKFERMTQDGELQKKKLTKLNENLKKLEQSTSNEIKLLNNELDNKEKTNINLKSKFKDSLSNLMELNNTLGIKDKTICEFKEKIENQFKQNESLKQERSDLTNKNEMNENEIINKLKTDNEICRKQIHDGDIEMMNYKERNQIALQKSKDQCTHFSEEIGNISKLYEDCDKSLVALKESTSSKEADYRTQLKDKVFENEELYARVTNLTTELATLTENTGHRIEELDKEIVAAKDLQSKLRETNEDLEKKNKNEIDCYELKISSIKEAKSKLLQKDASNEKMLSNYGEQVASLTEDCDNLRSERKKKKVPTATLR